LGKGSEPAMFSLCIFVLSLVGRLRQPVRLFIRRPKTKDCAAHSGERPVLLLFYQDYQEIWPRDWGDLAAAAHLFPPATGSYLAAKSSENSHGPRHRVYRRSLAVQRQNRSCRGADALQCGPARHRARHLPRLARGAARAVPGASAGGSWRVAVENVEAESDSPLVTDQCRPAKSLFTAI